MNQFMLVGTVVEKPELLKSPSGNNYLNLLVEEEKGWKNANGEFETVRYEVLCWKKFAEEIVEKIEANTQIAIKGHLDVEDNKTILTADKIVFVSEEV